VDEKKCEKGGTGAAEQGEPTGKRGGGNHDSEPLVPRKRKSSGGQPPPPCTAGKSKKKNMHGQNEKVQETPRTRTTRKKESWRKGVPLKDREEVRLRGRSRTAAGPLKKKGGTGGGADQRPEGEKGSKGTRNGEDWSPRKNRVNPSRGRPKREKKKKSRDRAWTQRSKGKKQGDIIKKEKRFILEKGDLRMRNTCPVPKKLPMKQSRLPAKKKCESSPGSQKGEYLSKGKGRRWQGNRPTGTTPKESQATLLLGKIRSKKDWVVLIKGKPARGGTKRGFFPL